MLSALQAKANERNKENGFSWVLDGKLGGMRYPQKEEELKSIIINHNIGLVVSLSEDPIRCINNNNNFDNIDVTFIHKPISGISFIIVCSYLIVFNFIIKTLMYLHLLKQMKLWN